MGINPDDIEEYIAVGGYQALDQVLFEDRPDNVIEMAKAALVIPPATSGNFWPRPYGDGTTLDEVTTE